MRRSIRVVLAGSCLIGVVVVQANAAEEGKNGVSPGAMMRSDGMMMGHGGMVRGMMGRQSERGTGMMTGCSGMSSMMNQGTGRPNDQWRRQRDHRDDEG